MAPEATLGLFSFLKLLMYHDLDHAADAAATHPILSLLAGEPPRDRSSGLDWRLPPAALDSRPPDECFQVLDAES